MTYLQHHGILGMKWGVRRYRNKHGTLTEAGKKKNSEASDKKKKIAKRVAIGAAFTASILGTSYIGVTHTAKKHILEEGKKRADEYIKWANGIAMFTPADMNRRAVYLNTATEITAKTNQKAKEIGSSFTKSARYLYNLHKKG